MGNSHDDPALEFLKAERRKDPMRYALLEAMYPMISPDRIRRLRKREQLVGLLGLEPCDIPLDVAFTNLLDANMEEEE